MIYKYDTIVHFVLNLLGFVDYLPSFRMKYPELKASHTRRTFTDYFKEDLHCTLHNRSYDDYVF